MDTVLDGAFADPVMQSQSVFRAVMDALANPGTTRKLVTPASVGSHLTSELASTLLTLTDHDTGIWLDETLRADRAVLDYLNFHIGSPVVSEPDKATFAFATSAMALPSLDAFNLGTQEYPDRSTTIVLAVPSLTGGPDLTLRGPGISGQRTINPAGLPQDFCVQWAGNRDVFPRGLDLLLVADGHVMGLPRSTRISEGN